MNVEASALSGRPPPTHGTPWPAPRAAEAVCHHPPSSIYHQDMLPEPTHGCSHWLGLPKGSARGRSQGAGQRGGVGLGADGPRLGLIACFPPVRLAGYLPPLSLIFWGTPAPRPQCGLEQSPCRACSWVRSDICGIQGQQGAWQGEPSCGGAQSPGSQPPGSPQHQVTRAGGGFVGDRPGQDSREERLPAPPQSLTRIWREAGGRKWEGPGTRYTEAGKGKGCQERGREGALGGWGREGASRAGGEAEKGREQERQAHPDGPGQSQSPPLRPALALACFVAARNGL